MENKELNEDFINDAIEFYIANANYHLILDRYFNDPYYHRNLDLFSDLIEDHGYVVEKSESMLLSLASYNNKIKKFIINKINENSQNKKEINYLFSNILKELKKGNKS